MKIVTILNKYAIKADKSAQVCLFDTPRDLCIQLFVRFSPMVSGLIP
jgi:hypothetical protein